MCLQRAEDTERGCNEGEEGRSNGRREQPRQERNVVCSVLVMGFQKAGECLGYAPCTNSMVRRGRGDGRDDGRGRVLGAETRLRGVELRKKCCNGGLRESGAKR
jgi:hypothetical protein